MMMMMMMKMMMMMMEKEKELEFGSRKMLAIGRNGERQWQFWRSRRVCVKKSQPQSRARNDFFIHLSLSVNRRKFLTIARNLPTRRANSQQRQLILGSISIFRAKV